MLRISASSAVAILLFAPMPADAAGGVNSFTQSSSAKIDFRATPFRPTRDCAALASELESGIRIASATLVPATDGVSEHCRINGTIPSEIGFQINLPAAWNGRLYMYGNGGYAGEDSEAPLEQKSRATALSHGFATARTDTGHLAVKEPLGTFAVNPEKVIDHGYRAVHETVTLAKKLVRNSTARRPNFPIGMAARPEADRA